jgi:DNA (cytosine-5)-methyltransferase 1
LWFIKSRRAQNVDDFETWVDGEVTPTLNAFDNNGDTRATVLIFYGNRVDDLRVQGPVINTLQARMGTGGNNMPMLAYPIQDGREMEKKQNGLGLGSETDPAYTIDTTGGQSVAYPIQGTVIGRSDTAGPQGKGYGNPDDPMFTIDTVGGHAVARVGNFELYDFPKEEIAPTLNAKRAKDTMAYEEAVVRRLTPLECERLQGFPDGWTDSQSDSQRYKQMGNAVAVPVVQWIINRLVEVDNGLNAKS